MSQATANVIVAYGPSGPGQPTWRHESVTLTRTEPGPKEVLVRMLASGICHTDIFVASVPEGMYGPFPKVLGHEGSGYVEAVGSEVTSVAVGDPVLLSYTYCGKCDLCEDGHKTYCQDFGIENVVCPDKIWKSNDGEIGGKFFGQSSFASLSLVDERSVVNAKDLLTSGSSDDEQREELKKFAPLGCGLMTGSGAVINTANAKPNDVILVIGLGAVGLAVIMAAKVVGCKAIIAVDRIPSRLSIAQDLGATHTLNTAEVATDVDLNHESYPETLASHIKALSPNDRINFAFDTTGLLPLINTSIRCLSKMGKLIQIGVPVPFPTATMPLDILDFFGGTKRFEINYLGDCEARVQVPNMIGWYREGKFPFDRFVKFYEAREFEKALEDMKGETVKPIIVH